MATSIQDAIKQYKDLKAQMEGGKLSQAEFITQAGGFLPEATRAANQYASRGRAYGNEANNQGLQELYGLARELNVYDSSQELLGRDITSQEVAQFMPRFNDPFQTETGRSYLAELASQEKNSSANLGKKAPEYSDKVNKQFQDLLSRGATAEEADYFGRLLASGQVTDYEINQFVQALPEYQNIQDKNFRGGLEGELAGYDEKAFGRERENILSQYTKAGLQNSSALDFAITDALGKVQEQRGQFLAGLSSQQYGGNKAAARSDYENMRNTYQGNQDYSRNRSDQYLDYLTQRSDQASDYQRQKDDYLNFLSSQPKQRGGNWLQGALGGAAAGSAFGPWGAGVGAGLGALSYLNS